QPNYPSYGGPPPPNFYPPSINPGLISGPPNYPPYSGSPYPPNYGPYGGPPPPHFPPSGNNAGIINELEKATNIDLNRDGRIGGSPNYPSYNQPYGGESCASHYGSYNGPPPPNFYTPGNGAGLIGEFEKATNIDLNHDGRIG
ncbi:unnamed protein product, partial [Didymodactylos carnosus]